MIKWNAHSFFSVVKMSPKKLLIQPANEPACNQCPTVSLNGITKLATGIANPPPNTNSIRVNRHEIEFFPLIRVIVNAISLNEKNHRESRYIECARCDISKH